MGSLCQLSWLRGCRRLGLGVGANTVDTCLLQCIWYFGLGAAAPSRSYMDPPLPTAADYGARALVYGNLYLYFIKYE